jgi:ATP-dependent Clp protease ATP-binding subunit ClpA
MFERFTKDARDTVVRAQYEAHRLGHEHIGTEHLLLGVATGEGRARDVLEARGVTATRLRAAIEADTLPALDAGALATLGIDLDEVRERVEGTFGPGALTGRRACRRGWLRGRVVPPFTPRAKKALELSLREALALGDNFIGAEHVLLGLLREGDGVAAQILRSRGVERAAVQAALLRARQTAR